MIKFVASFANNFRKNCRKPLVRVTLGAILATSLIGGALFSIFEPEASYWDGIYWTWVVMPTVGFGDFSPTTEPGRLLYIGVVAVGWFSSVVGAGIVMDSLAERREAAHLETIEIDDDLTAVVDALKVASSELEALTHKVKHPKIIAALHEIHAETNGKAVV